MPEQIAHPLCCHAVIKTDSGESMLHVSEWVFNKGSSPGKLIHNSEVENSFLGHLSPDGRPSPSQAELAWCRGFNTLAAPEAQLDLQNNVENSQTVIEHL
jgi:hypothetical protein